MDIIERASDPADLARVSACQTVIVVSDFAYVQGGAAKVAVDEALSLRALGLRVIFFSAVGPVGPQLAGSDIEVICLNQPQLLDVARHPLVALQSMWNHTARKAMADVLRSADEAHTVIHVHSYMKALSTAPIALARSRGFQVVCTLHDFFAACPNGGFFDYVQNAPCMRTALSRECITAPCDKRKQVHKVFRVARGFAQRTVNHFPGNVDDYIGLSRRSVEVMRPYLPQTARLHMLSNAVEAERRPPVAVAENSALIYVGRLDEEKGVRGLAQAAAMAGMKVVFVGEGPLRAELEAIEGVSVTGWQTPAEVTARLDAARCLVFPSLWYETFGLVVEEAAARGVPAVISDISAPSERIRDGETGWVFPAGSVDALAAVLRQTADDDTVRRVGAAVYRRFWEGYRTRAQHAGQLLEIYAGMLADPR